MLGASNKPDKKQVPDFMRFKNAGKYFAPGVRGGESDVEGGVPTLTAQNVFQVTPEALSASDLRKAIRDSDTQVVMRYMPVDVAKNEQALQAIFDILDIGAAPRVDTPSISEQIIRMVEDVIEERCQKGYKTHEKRKTKKMYGKTYRNCVKAEGEELEEMSTMSGGSVQGAAVDSDEGDTPWVGLDASAENKKQEKAQRLKGTKLTKEQLIQKVMDYLLAQE